MKHREAREFIRNHFEEFVNKKNVQVGNLNFAADFVDHGAAGNAAWAGGSDRVCQPDAWRNCQICRGRSIQNAKKDGYLKLAATTVKRAESQS
jgi:hypothetical protein